MKNFNDYIHNPRDVPAAEEPAGILKGSFSIQKSNDEKMQVFGWASVAVTDTGEQVEDLQGDMIDPEDLEQAAYEYVRLYGDGGEMHEPTKRIVAKIIESAVFTEDKMKAMGIPSGTLPVGWWIGFQVLDEEVWGKVKDGTYSMFSIEGTAERVETPDGSSAPMEKKRQNKVTKALSSWHAGGFLRAIDLRKGRKQLAAKLKNLHLVKVDLVDEGANQHADISLIKNREGRQAAPEPDGGQAGGMAQGADTEQENIFLKFARWLKGKGYTMDDVEKAATSFQDQMAANASEAIDSEIFDITYALRNSFGSILADPEIDVTAKASAMLESLSQFTGSIQACIPKWSAGYTAGLQKRAEKPDERELAVMEKDRDALSGAVTKAKETEEPKGEPEDMLKIDKSRMTPEERAAYDEIVRKYAADTDEENGTEASGGADPELREDIVDDGVSKSAPQAAVSEDSGTEILKGVIADLQKEITGLKEANLTQELAAVAKKYEPLGKKPEELVETLKKAKKAGVYDDVIAAYDSALAAQEASGIFGEIGKSASGGDDSASAIAKARAAAAELKKNDPSLTDAQALDKVLLSDPELMKEFDQ